MNKVAAIRFDHVVKTSFFMKSQCQRSVLPVVTEAVLHLVAVLEQHRARFDPFKAETVLPADTFQESPDSFFLFTKLECIGTALPFLHFLLSFTSVPGRSFR